MIRIGAILALAASLAGCAACRRPDVSPPAPINLGPPPAYAEVAAAVNARVAPLDRLWSTSVARIWYPDREGEEQSEQVEGHFQYIRPDKLLMTFNKVGETYAALGSNAEQYWWIELRDTRRASVGKHDRVTPERVADLGLPVHPLDLIELLGVTGLPADGGSTAWSETGIHLVVTVPARHGMRRVTLAPDTYEPVTVELLGADGSVQLDSSLRNYESVRVNFGQPSARVAREVLIADTKAGVRLRLRLPDAESRSSRPKDRAFDLGWVLNYYKVDEVTSLDESEELLR